MTTIGTMPPFLSAQRYAGADRSASRISFGDEVNQAATGSEPSSALEDLLAESEALKKQQLHMSRNDYLTAFFTLNEKIGAERLKAGEDLDTFGVRFEGRTFTLAGKMYDSSFLKEAQASDIEMVAIATPKAYMR